MKVSADSLVEALAVVKPAVATRGFIHALTCVFFDGDCVYAYNGEVGIKKMLNVGASGGVQGKTLFKMVKGATGDVALSSEGGGLSLEWGSNAVDLQAVSKRDFVFEWPKSSDGAVICGGFVEALRVSALATGETNTLSTSGVFVKADDNGLVVSATNGATLAHSTVFYASTDLQEMFSDEMFLSASFVKRLVVAADKGFTGLLTSGTGYFMAEFSNGVSVYGSTVDTDGAVDFKSVVDSVTASVKDYAAIPDDYVQAVGKASTGDGMVWMESDGGFLDVSGGGAAGSFVSSMEFVAAKCGVKCDGKDLTKGAKVSDLMSLTPTAAVFKNTNREASSLFLVSKVSS